MQVEGHSIGFIPEADRYGHPRPPVHDLGLC